MNEELFETNDKGAKIAFLVVLGLIVLGVIGYFVYDLVFNRPSMKLINFISKIKEQEVFKDKEVKLSGDLVIKSKIKDFDYLENAKANYGLIIDDKTDTFILDFEYLEKDKKIFDFVSFMDNKKMYVISEQIFGNKPLYVDIDEEEEEAEADIEYLVRIYLKALASSFKGEKPIKKDIRIDINNDTIKVRENKFSITKENVDRINNNYRKSLLSDDKAISIIAKYSSETKEEIKKEIEKEYGVIDEKDVKDNYYFSIYTKGLFNTFVGCKLGHGDKSGIEYVIYNDYNLFTVDTGEDAKFIIEGKVDSLKYRVTDGKNDLLFGNIVKYSENNYAVTMEMKDCFELKFTLKEDKDLKIEKPNVEGEVEIDSLKDEDFEHFKENYDKLLESSEVYTKLIKPFFEEEEKSE